MGTALSVQVKYVSGNVHGLNREVGGLRGEVAGLSNKVCYNAPSWINFPMLDDSILMAFLDR